jgi:hypothetical protein
LPPRALDWTPLPAETSSIAMLAHHSADALRWWIVQELAGKPTDYDRTRDFAARDEDAAALAAWLNGVVAECAATLRGLDPALLDRIWPVSITHPQQGQQRSGHYRIVSPLLHLSEHIGQAQLTRQLWQARQAE